MTFQQSIEQQRLSGLDESLPALLHDTNVPGLALAVVKGEEVILSRGYGKRNVADDLEVTPQTLFAIGSSTKAFTTMGVAILVDEGKLAWEKPLKEYLPSFQLFDPVATERMTLRDLLIHNSGLPRYDLLWQSDATLTRKEIVARLQYLEPTHEFRTTWQYQNLMYATAGYLIEVISGQSWEEFTRQRILDPLGMNSTNFSVNDSQHTSDVALPYREMQGTVQRMAFFDRFQALGPAGGINAPVTDMAKWVGCLLHKGTHGEQRLVSQAQFQQLVTPQIITPDLPTFFTRYPETFSWTYALGWFVTSYRGHLMVQHGGNIDGFSAMVGFLPDDQIGIVVLTNLHGTPAAFSLLYHLCDRLLGLEEVGWHKRFQKNVDQFKELLEKSKQERAAKHITDAPLTHPLSAYTGAYDHPAFGTFTVTQEGDTLKGCHNDLDCPLTHLHYDLFEVALERRESTCLGWFGMNRKGEIESFSIELGLEPGTKPVVFERAPEKGMQEKAFLSQFVGDYEVMGRTLTIALKGEQALWATLPGQPPLELEPYRGTEFRLKGRSGIGLAFLLDEGGQVNAAVISQPQSTLTAYKKGQDA